MQTRPSSLTLSLLSERHVNMNKVKGAVKEYFMICSYLEAADFDLVCQEPLPDSSCFQNKKAKNKKAVTQGQKNNASTMSE